MADENMTEWTPSATIEQETIAAVVKAYAAGRIVLAAPSGREDQWRHAPSYLPRSNGASPHTVATVAAFLVWPTSKVERAVGARLRTDGHYEYS